MKIKEYFEIQKERVEKKLDKYLPLAEKYPSVIHNAMRYSVFSGGKRIRPIMSIMGFETFKGKGDKILPVACAIELIHTYSLIHDDLPDIDNDDLRRGKPSCHRKFSPAVAILTGDALLIEGFKLLTFVNEDSTVKKLVSCLSNKIGSFGMNGGQIIDIQRSLIFDDFKNLSNKEKDKFLKQSEYVNAYKTAALIEAAFMSGAITAKASDADINNIKDYAYCIGFLFQLVDDILDRDGYVLVLGESKTEDKAKKFVEEAKEKAKKVDRDNQLLTELPDYIFQRINI